ncbi:hypothetical protein C8A03DRAFT_33801 [Achaetomium macrosporum]|uniref:Uncharacterized protein n=1 Tax=Achaetomium macrosporum TaxID=79813 RepID=A0AAN7CAJ3_9PEZI|nr:hypothetical protein C8A03DRAFT_33801 [Achaetomium macrosporum]
MANNANGLVQLGAIRRKTLSERETDIVNAFALAMRPRSSVPEAAVEAVRRLDSLCPPLEQGDDAGNYIWRMWEIMLGIAESLDVDDEVYWRLLSVLQELERNAYGRPCLSLGSASTPANCVLAPYPLIMHAARSALENEQNTLPITLEMAEWKIKIACAWLTYGGAGPLLRWVQENWSYDYEEDERNCDHVGQGPLYDGPAMMCFERWQFWLDRLCELAKSESGMSEETSQAALEAVHAMREVEESMADVGP